MSDTTIPTDRRPIGFWLKLVDRLIDERLGATLSQYGLTRRGWQVLNVVRDEPLNIDGIDERLRPFLGESEPTTGPLVEQLHSDGWLSGEGGSVGLAADRHERFESLLRSVSADRRTMVEGIEVSDYATTMTVLARLARNLGWEDTSGVLVGTAD